MNCLNPPKLLWLAVALAALARGGGGGATEANAPFEQRDGDRVLFIGDKFFEREVDSRHMETRLTGAFPDHNVTFRNLAWAGDTPMGQARALRLEQV